MPQRSYHVSLLFAGLLTASACNTATPPVNGEADPTAAGEAAPTAPAFAPAEGTTLPSDAPAAAAEEPALHTVVTSTRVEEDGSLVLVTDFGASEGYHLNTDANFPWRVKVADDAPVGAGTTQGAADAIRLEEQDARFEIRIAEPGDAASIPGEVVLGVCDDAGCVRVREEVVWAAVQQ